VNFTVKIYISNLIFSRAAIGDTVSMPGCVERPFFPTRPTLCILPPWRAPRLRPAPPARANVRRAQG